MTVQQLINRLTLLLPIHRLQPIEVYVKREDMFYAVKDVVVNPDGTIELELDYK